MKRFPCGSPLGTDMPLGVFRRLLCLLRSSNSSRVAVIGILVFGMFLAWQGYTLAMKTWPRIIPMLGVNEGWRAVPMAICGVQVVIFSIYHLGELARGEFKLVGEL